MITESAELLEQKRTLAMIDRLKVLAPSIDRVVVERIHTLLAEPPAHLNDSRNIQRNLSWEINLTTRSQDCLRASGATLSAAEAQMKVLLECRTEGLA